MKDLNALKDRLTGALIGLARATEGNEHLLTGSTATVTAEGLMATLPNANSDEEALLAILKRIDEEKRKLVPECYRCASSCGRTEDYDMRLLSDAEADNRKLRHLLLLGIRGLSTYVCQAAALGRKDDTIHSFLYKALFAVGREDWDRSLLLPILLELGEMQLKCLALLE